MVEFSTKGLAEYTTDADAERTGIKVKISDEVAFFIRRAGGRNLRYERALAKHSKDHIRRLRNNTMPNDEIRRLILLPTYLDAVILDWEGICDTDGNEVPFTRENCERFLRDSPAGPNILDEIVAIAGDMAAFRKQELEETADAVGES